MDTIVALLSQMSFESIFLFILAIIIAAKVLSELFEWAYEKLKKYFNIKDRAEERQEEIIERLDRIESRSIDRDKRVQSIEETLSMVQQRLQDSTRSYLIDKYHYYVQELGVIDEAALQDIERRYLYYKNSGGDSFIELRMEEIRNLPIITAEQLSAARQRSFDNVKTMLTTDDVGR